MFGLGGTEIVVLLIILIFFMLIPFFLGYFIGLAKGRKEKIWD
jgi:hypothetical protein